MCVTATHTQTEAISDANKSFESKVEERVNTKGR